MNNFILDASDKTPFFKLRKDGNLKFGGTSMPEDAPTFYRRVFDWISDYQLEPNIDTSITVGFRYLNSSSSRMIFHLFKRFKKIQETGKSNIKCKWYFEEDDTDMKEYIDEVVKHSGKISFEILETEDIREILL